MAGISFAVSTIFKSKDEQSKNFKRMGKNAKLFGKKTKTAFKESSKAATKFGTIAKGILAAGAVQKALGGVSAGLSSVTTDFLNFDNAVLSAAAKFKGLDLSAQSGIDTLEALKKTARDVGATTEFNAAQAAEGLDFLALAGFNAEQAMKLLPGVTNLATVAQIDLATATDIASDSLGAFGLMTEDTEQLGKNFTRVQDVMAKTIATSNTSLEDLFETVKAGAAAFTTAGQDMETFNALTAVMANSGLKGSKAGLVLKNMMNRLAKPSAKAAEMMEELNFRVDDGKGGFADATVIIDRFNEATKNLTEIQKVQATAQIFGSEIQTGMTLLFKEGGEQIRSYRQTLLDAAGAAEKMAEIMRSSLLNRLKSLGSAATEVGFQLFSAFDKQGAGAIDKLTQVIRTIDLTPFIEKIKTVGKFAGEMFDKFIEFGNKSGFFDTIKISIDGAISLFKTVFNIVSDLLGKFARVSESSGIFDAIQESMKQVFPFFEKIAVFVGGVVDEFGKIAAETGLFDTIKEAIDEIMPFFNTLFDIVKTGFNLLSDIGVFDLIVLSFKTVISVITTLAKGFTSLWEIVKPILIDIAEFIKPIIEAFKPFAEVIGQAIPLAFSKMWDFVKPIIEKFTKFLAPVGDFVSGIFDKFGGLSGIKDSIVNSIKDATVAVQSEVDLNNGQQEQRGANQTQLESRASQVDVSGQINFSNAPEGTTFEPATAPANKINFNDLGKAN